ncbi:trypsin-like peptidase domain-containing protein [Streptomyces sp. CSDS2]|uniref:VMAP-C domain-containing protein n=1 Tax=Streptomyces sp. CSDS2 TaxID=3055051 RepID=UPI0025AEEB34|nr:trypsin-like peptidase domain-containing protein [Streptomyces sp. CSDS2]MDN3260622.1 trypsin-like peptidase domain-containing protein [Streptomyces sp. CSDS2]
MRGAAWHARIACGRFVGAGFLVTGRLLLTCAHVVRERGRAPVTVSFPHARELGELSATVIAHGDWGGRETDPGDVAVLELAKDIPLAPARFAPPEAAYTEPYPKLVSYGFPKDYDEGTLAEYQAVSAQLIAGEWLELVTWHGHGQPIVEGFSGAAATLPDGRVVGMVTTALGTSPEVRKGRMLPLDVLARYWPGLAELVPVPGLGDDGLRRLYDLLGRAAADPGAGLDPNRLYLDAVGLLGPPLPPGGFPSLRAAADYVRWEVPDPDALPRFADRLAGLLDGRPESPLRPAPDAATAQDGPLWSPVVVEIDHSGAGPDQVTVEVSAYRDGRRRPVGARRLPRTGVRAYVQSRIDEAVAHLAPDADELVTFVLPREWLNEAVAHWECGADDSTPLGCAYPLVVTDRARHHSGRLRHQLRKKWQKLDTGGGAEVHRVECGTRERPPSLRKRLWDGDARLAGFAAPPTAARPLFEVGLTVPVPVLLWPRTGTPCAVHGDAPRAEAVRTDTPRAETVRTDTPRVEATRTPGAKSPRTNPPYAESPYPDTPDAKGRHADPSGADCPYADPAGSGGPHADAACPGTDFLDRLTASIADVPPAELPRHVMSLRLTAEAADEPERHWARHLQLLWDDPRCFPETGASLHSPVA